MVNAGAVEEIAGLLTRRTISTDVSQFFPFPEFKYQFPHEKNIVSGFVRVNEGRYMKLYCLKKSIFVCAFSMCCWDRRVICMTERCDDPFI